MQVSSRSVTIKRLTVGRHGHQSLASFNQSGFLNKFSYGKAFTLPRQRNSEEDPSQTEDVYRSWAFRKAVMEPGN